ncbi:oxygenase MpaB family protein [Mycobacterium sp. pUA109]|uniref:oxygenase MpaB family protein n=1 Tax=Mycobacterium sp. pUA109 TaxID=3238982 RepID=UPI00351B9D4A
MSTPHWAPDAEAPSRLTTAQTRIQIGTYTRRWNTEELVDPTDALDFWTAAASAANVIMQMANPGVGYGVVESRVESGALMEHPWKRLRTTAQYLAVAVLGTEEERAAYREAVNVVHRQVRSTSESPVKYNAFDRDLQLWVAACLFIFYEDTYQLLHGRMTEEQAENFYQHARPIGTTLQVTDKDWPATRAEFDVYWNTQCAHLRIDEPIREYAFKLINLKMITPILRIILAPLLRFLTVGFLAPHFREMLGVSWSETEQRQFENLFLFVSFVNRFLPRFLRTYNYTVLMTDIRRRIRRHKALV